MAPTDPQPRACGGRPAGVGLECRRGPL